MTGTGCTLLDQGAVHPIGQKITSLHVVPSFASDTIVAAIEPVAQGVNAVDG